MNYDEYGEVINGNETYKEIAELLSYEGEKNKSRACIIGWTDKLYDHRDILFTYKPIKYGNLQRGLRWCYLYVSIMDCTAMGFLIESDIDNRKDIGYLKEKLRLHDNHCDEICILINGVIHELDKLEENI